MSAAVSDAMGFVTPGLSVNCPRTNPPPNSCPSPSTDVRIASPPAFSVCRPIVRVAMSDPSHWRFVTRIARDSPSVPRPGRTYWVDGVTGSNCEIGEPTCSWALPSSSVAPSRTRTSCSWNIEAWREYSRPALGRASPPTASEGFVSSNFSKLKRPVTVFDSEVVTSTRARPSDCRYSPV